MPSMFTLLEKIWCGNCCKDILPGTEVSAVRGHRTDIVGNITYDTFYRCPFCGDFLQIPEGEIVTIDKELCAK